MIKIGITGAGSPNAGELIRILINHPEADIRSLYEPELLGRAPSSVHHGLLGESIVNFSDKLNPEELDIVFLTNQTPFSQNLIENKNNWPELKLIDLTANDEKAMENRAFAIGVSEINRKNLVRTVTTAFIPSQVLVPALIALFPLAQFMLLNNPLEVSIALPKDLLSEIKPLDDLEKLLSRAITVAQPSFSSPIHLTLEENSDENRVMVMKISFNCTLSIDEIEKIYEGIYDDHNFTFVTHTPVSVKEVEGNQKCIISLNKDAPSSLEITAIVDGRMRGGAGDAVHIMNLLQGLYEKTGLQLKSSSFHSPDSPGTISWFA